MRYTPKWRTFAAACGFLLVMLPVTPRSIEIIPNFNDFFERHRDTEWLELRTGLWSRRLPTTTGATVAMIKIVKNGIQFEVWEQCLRSDRVTLTIWMWHPDGSVGVKHDCEDVPSRTETREWERLMRPYPPYVGQLMDAVIDLLTRPRSLRT